MRKWRIEDSSELYNVPGWGRSYFSINEKGHAQVSPRPGGMNIDLMEVMNELQLRDVTAPVLLRFPEFPLASRRLQRSTGTPGRTLWYIPSR